MGIFRKREGFVTKGKAGKLTMRNSLKRYENKPEFTLK